MRIANFIELNQEAILAEWESFARGIAAGLTMSSIALRDHGVEILQAISQDMREAQSGMESSEKSKGHRGPPREGSDSLNTASNLHAIRRLGSGFDLLEVVSEYRALRASVLRLWQESLPGLAPRDVEDITRFNESIDQLITRAVRSFTQRIDQARDMYLAILGHDLRNPLNSITMSAQILPHLAPNYTDAGIYTTQIATDVKVMGRMINDLLDYTRTRLGTGMPVKPAAMDLTVLGKAVFDEFRTANPKRDLRMQAIGDLKGSWDTDRLRQAISNLIGNAIQHGSPDEPVILSMNGNARGDGSQVLIEVKNGGEPISAAEMPRIFDPLIRGTGANEPRRNRPGSIGLGLYIAREVAKSHGGRIAVSSTPAETRFTIYLPRHSNLKSPAPGVMDEGAIQKM